MYSRCGKFSSRDQPNFVKNDKVLKNIQNIYIMEITKEKVTDMEIKWYKYTDEGIKDSFFIREEVFVKEVGFSHDFEFDDSDKQALHLVLYENGRPVCNARIIKESENSYHLGRIACIARHRGKGYGKVAVNEAVRKAAEMGAKKVTLGAKYDKKTFYEKLGFTAYGDIFDEEGIPHINMYKDL